MTLPSLTPDGLSLPGRQLSAAYWYRKHLVALLEERWRGQSLHQQALQAALAFVYQHETRACFWLNPAAADQIQARVERLVQLRSKSDHLPLSGRGTDVS